MKKILWLSLLMVSASFAVFANGAADKEGNIVPGASEEITVSGKLVLEDEYSAAITSSGITYYLHVPPYVYDLDQVKDGMTLSVNGYAPEMPVWADDNTQILVVNTVVINGEEFTIMNHGRRDGGNTYCFDDNAGGYFGRMNPGTAFGRMNSGRNFNDGYHRMYDDNEYYGGSRGMRR